MTNKYLSVQGCCVTEKVIEKSKFITESRHVESEEEAKEFIAEVRKKFPDATHHCSAYISDALGNNLRFSDDGEPQGTAGMPMLDVLKAQKLKQVAVVVTRYFGGIKLGAGGLVRAYSGCVAENLNSAQKVSYELCAESNYTVSYADVDACARFFDGRDCTVINRIYADSVTFVVAVRESDGPDFEGELKNYLNGRVKIERCKTYYFPFKV